MTPDQLAALRKSLKALTPDELINYAINTTAIASDSASLLLVAHSKLRRHQGSKKLRDAIGAYLANVAKLIGMEAK
jgi:hypothetical protein